MQPRPLPAVHMPAPERFCEWMSSDIANDHKFGRKVYRYHPRSDEHSKVLCRLVIADLLDACPTLKQHAMSRSVVGGTNVKYKFSNGKGKALDLGIGTPLDSVATGCCSRNRPSGECPSGRGRAGCCQHRA